MSEPETNSSPENQVDNVTTGGESVLESFPTESVSEPYVPNQETLIEDLTRHTAQNSSIGPLVTLVREQSAEIENLKIAHSDLTATNAALRSQLSDAEQKILEMADEKLEMLQKISDLEKKIEERQETPRETSLQDLRDELNNLKLRQSILPKKLRFFKSL